MFNYISYIYTDNDKTTYGHVEVDAKLDTSWVKMVRSMTQCKDPVLEYISPPYATRLADPLSLDPEHAHTHCQNVSYAAGNTMRTVEVGLDPDDTDGLRHFEKKYAAVKAICKKDVIPVIINITPPYRAVKQPVEVDETIETVSFDVDDD